MTSTRRQLIAQAATVCSVAMLPSNVWASADHGAESGAMGTKPIHMVEDFSVSPERVYGALLDGKQFHEITGQRSEIDPVPGGAFNIFNDRIVGRNLELVKNQGIVQAWREPAWDDGVYSIVRFDIKTQGSGTRLVFDHWGFPEAGRPHLIIGWKEHYFEPMRKYFAERAGRSPC